MSANHQGPLFYRAHQRDMSIPGFVYIYYTMLPSDDTTAPWNIQTTVAPSAGMMDSWAVGDVATMTEDDMEKRKQAYMAMKQVKQMYVEIRINSQHENQAVLMCKNLENVVVRLTYWNS